MALRLGYGGAEREQPMDQQNAIVSMRQTLEQDLGSILLRVVRSAKDGTALLVVPVGSEEVHVEMSLKPLNPHVRPDDPMILNLLDQLADAVDKVRNSPQSKIRWFGREREGDQNADGDK